MSIRLHVFNETEDRPASIEEIERLFLNCLSDGTGLADLDFKMSNGVAKEPNAAGFAVTVVQEK
jgi:hypothetical protein